MKSDRWFARNQTKRRGARGVRLGLELLEPRNLLSFGGTPYAVGPTVTPTTTEPEAEGHIAVDPNDFHNLLAAVSDNSVRRLGFHPAQSKYAFSSDNGATWTDKYVPIDLVSGLLPTGDGRAWTTTQDPVVAIDKSGNAFMANMYLNWDAATGTIQENGVYVGVTTVKSLSKLGTGASSGFTAAQTYPVVVSTIPSTPPLEDKEWIAVDNSTSAYSGDVYVSWTHISADGYVILLSRSSDHAQSWSAPTQVSPFKNWHGGVIQWSQVAVGPSGEVYVVYEEYNGGGNGRLFLTKSTDGGVTFSEPVAITGNFHTLSFDSTYPKQSLPSLAVSSTNGNVYVAYADEPNKTAGAEVEFIRSTDGGANFSDPVAINDTAVGQQFMPAVTVDEAGVIHASWFDTRNSPSGSSVYDIYATFSTDGGATFRPNARVTADSINVGPSFFIGDYAGIAAGGGFAHPVWTTSVYQIVGGDIVGTGGLRTATLKDDPPIAGSGAASSTASAGLASSAALADAALAAMLDARVQKPQVLSPPASAARNDDLATHPIPSRQPRVKVPVARPTPRVAASHRPTARRAAASASQTAQAVDRSLAQLSAHSLKADALLDHLRRGRA